MDGFTDPEGSLFEALALLADPTRGRFLLLLEERELTVSELCAVLQLPQSTVSRHLKALGDAGWVASRRDGTRRLYRAVLEHRGAWAERLWDLIREVAAELPAAAGDTDRLVAVLAERRTKSQEFFASTAAQWDRLRRELFGERGEVAPLLALLDPAWTVGDLGCGTGRLAEALAPFVARVIAVDDSEAMLAVARERLSRSATAEVRQGRLEALPLPDGSLDVAILALVLHHLPEPARALWEVARVLRPGGRVLVVEMQAHDREEYRQEMGHVWLGFTPEGLSGWLAEADFEAVRAVPLPADLKAQGPPLLTVTAVAGRRSAAHSPQAPAAPSREAAAAVSLRSYPDPS